jgi:Xaa-Pro aminopeptidase
LEHALVTEGRTDLDEYQITLVLEKYRRSAKHNAGLSFATISSSGPNAAIVHYHPHEGNSSPVIRE